MNTLSRSLLVCLALAASSAKAGNPPPAAGDQIRFAGGESLHGRFASYSPEDGVAWQHPEALAPLVFKADRLSEVEFDRAPAQGVAQVLVRLEGGDALPGTLVEYGPDKVVLDTAYAGRVTVPTDRVRALAFGGGGPRVEGFGKFSDWTQQNNGRRDGARIVGGKLELSGYSWVSRELPFGEQFRLEIGAEAGRELLHVGFCLSKPMDGRDWPSGYFLYLHQRGMVVYAYTQGSHENLAQFQFETDSSQPVRLEVRGDATAKTLTFLVNGKQVGVVRNLKKFHAGKCLALGNNGGQATYTRLALGAGIPEEAPAAALTQDAVRFANQDQAPGTLLWVRAGRAALKTEAGNLEFPLDRLARVDLAGEKKKPAKAAGQSRLYFDSATRLTLKVDRIKDGKVIGSNEMLGACTVDLAALQKIRFNLDAPWRQEAKARNEAAKKKQEGANEPVRRRGGGGIFFGGGGIAPLILD